MAILSYHCKSQSSCECPSASFCIRLTSGFQSTFCRNVILLLCKHWPRNIQHMTTYHINYQQFEEMECRSTQCCFVHNHNYRVSHCTVVIRSHEGCCRSHSLPNHLPHFQSPYFLLATNSWLQIGLYKYIFWLQIVV
jgi:hypothetical protein